jgi:hypothetical protein
MKRKIVNPNPQEKKMKQMEEKIYDHEVKEQIIKAEEEIEDLKKNKDFKRKTF